MKKVILPIITLFACTANTMAEETNKMYLWMTDGTVVEYNVADVDSLTFQKYRAVRTIPDTSCCCRSCLAALLSRFYCVRLFWNSMYRI